MVAAVLAATPSQLPAASSVCFGLHLRIHPGRFYPRSAAEGSTWSTSTAWANELVLRSSMSWTVHKISIAQQHNHCVRAEGSMLAAKVFTRTEALFMIVIFCTYH